MDVPPSRTAAVLWLMSHPGAPSMEGAACSRPQERGHKSKSRVAQETVASWGLEKWSSKCVHSIGVKERQLKPGEAMSQPRAKVH